MSRGLGSVENFGKRPKPRQVEGVPCWLNVQKNFSTLANGVPLLFEPHIAVQKTASKHLGEHILECFHITASFTRLARQSKLLL